MRDLVIYGAGYPEVVKLVHAINRTGPAWRVVGFVDDTLEPGSRFMNLPVLGGRDRLAELRDSGAAFVNNVCKTD